MEKRGKLVQNLMSVHVHVHGRYFPFLHGFIQIMFDSAMCNKFIVINEWLMNINRWNWKFTEKNIDNPNRKIAGRALSTASTSFENRFKMRPNGVVSKISIGQRSTLTIKIRCISRADIIKPSDIVIDETNDNVAGKERFLFQI